MPKRTMGPTPLDVVEPASQKVAPDVDTEPDRVLHDIVRHAQTIPTAGTEPNRREVWEDGTIPEDPSLEGGYFVAPTVLGDVTRTMTVARRELRTSRVPDALPERRRGRRGGQRH